MKKIYLQPAIRIAEMVNDEFMGGNMNSVRMDGTLPDGTPIGVSDEIGEGEDVDAGAKRRLWDDEW